MSQSRERLLASVIIPAYNAERTLARCIESLLQQSVSQDNYEIIVVDDASTDSTASVGERYPVRTERQAHAGPAAARNLGAQLARGDVLLFTDADCAPTPSWITEMLKPFDDPRVVGVKGTYRTEQQELVARFVQLEYVEKYRRMAQADSIDFIDTYSAAYRRSVFLENGGFDTVFTVPSAEDQELSFRLAEQGHRMTFAPDAVVLHTHPDSAWWYFRRKVRFGYWQTLNRWKHPAKILRDSYTPETQKVQLASLALLAPATFVALLDNRWWMADVLLVSVFAVSTLPFIKLTLTLDPPVAAAAVPLLVLRAAGVLVGLAAGCIAFPLKWLTQRATVESKATPK